MRLERTARLTWLRQSEGGRPVPPPGPSYSTVAKFSAQKTDWRDEAWSLVIRFLEPPDRHGSHRVAVRFLADEAPSDFLAEGCRFQLMEGERVVARGVVLAPEAGPQ